MKTGANESRYSKYTSDLAQDRDQALALSNGGMQGMVTKNSTPNPPPPPRS